MPAKIQYDCTKCPGWCCSYERIPVTPSDIVRLARHLNGTTLDVARRSAVWATRHAVAVLTPPTRWVKVTVSVDRLNLAKGPVDVKVSCDNAVVVDTRVTDVRPITRYVALRDGNKGMMVETRVSRSVRPADFGLQDPRERGLLVEWEFSAPQ